MNNLGILPAKPVYKGTESLSFLAPKLWELIPENIKSIDSLLDFKLAKSNGSLMAVRVV